MLVREAHLTHCIHGDGAVWEPQVNPFFCSTWNKSGMVRGNESAGRSWAPNHGMLMEGAGRRFGLIVRDGFENGLIGMMSSAPWSCG